MDAEKFGSLLQPLVPEDALPDGLLLALVEMNLEIEALKAAAKRQPILSGPTDPMDRPVVGGVS